MGAPSTYVPLPDDLARRKVEVLDACFDSQLDRGHRAFAGDVGIGTRGVRQHADLDPAIGGHCTARDQDTRHCQTESNAAEPSSIQS